MIKGAAVTYGDIALGAKESFQPTSSEQHFDTLGNLQSDDLQPHHYATPCELYQTILDGSAEFLPDDSPETGLWSEQLSGSDGGFEAPILLTLESEIVYSSPGFTMTFDKFNHIFPTTVKIVWIQKSDKEETVLSEKVFYPDSGEYFFQNKVENFNKSEISFFSLNMPYNRLKLEAITYGEGTVFYGNELKNVKIQQYTDPISMDLKISGGDIAILKKRDSNDFSFTANQPISISFNGEHVAETFIKTSRRTGKYLFELTVEDFIGLLDSVEFSGGVYNDKSAKTLIEEICSTANVPYEIRGIENDPKLSGYLSISTCREALRQVCFACQFAVVTAFNKTLVITKFDDDVKQTIPLNRIMAGQNFEYSERYTSLTLGVHTYKKTSERAEAYNADNDGAGNNIMIQFSEPLHTLQIGSYMIDEETGKYFVEDNNYGEILKRGENFALINAREGCVLQGQKYSHSVKMKTLEDGSVLSNGKENTVTIDTATLVSDSNVDEVLEKCLSYMNRTTKINTKIIEGKTVVYERRPIKWGEKKWGTFTYGGTVETVSVTEEEPVRLGDVLRVKTEYSGEAEGQLIEQVFNLNGNILVKEAVLQ